MTAVIYFQDLNHPNCPSHSLTCFTTFVAIACCSRSQQKLNLHINNVVKNHFVTFERSAFSRNCIHQDKKIIISVIIIYEHILNFCLMFLMWMMAIYLKDDQWYFNISYTNCQTKQTSWPWNSILLVVMPYWF